MSLSGFTYTVIRRCDNCGHENRKEVSKGQLAPEYVTCNNCGCRTDGKSRGPGYAPYSPGKARW